MIVTIVPVEDNFKYKVNEHTIFNNAGDWCCSTEMSQKEMKAWEIYDHLILKNSRFKKHPRSTYKTHGIFKD